MIDTSDAFVLLNTLVLLLVFAAFWRLLNSKGRVEWDVHTTAPEPSNAMLLELTRERDDARRVAVEMRARFEGSSAS